MMSYFTPMGITYIDQWSKTQIYLVCYDEKAEKNHL